MTRALLPQRVDFPVLQIVPVRRRKSSLNVIDNNKRTRSSISVKRNAAVSETQFRFCSLRSCNFRLSSAFQSAYFFFVISECSVCSFSFRCKLLICILFSRNLLCYPSVIGMLQRQRWMDKVLTRFCLSTSALRLMILCSNSLPICLTFSLASHDSKFSSFRSSNTSRWSPVIACITLLPGSGFPGLCGTASDGNSAYGQTGVGSTISTSRWELSAMDVLTISWSETRGLLWILTVRIGGVEFMDPKPVSPVSTINDGGAATLSLFSAGATSGKAPLCHAKCECRNSSNKVSATILAVSYCEKNSGPRISVSALCQIICG